MFFGLGVAQWEGARVWDSVLRRGERDGEGGRGGMEDMTAMGETVVDGIRGRAEGMSGREDEAMDGV